jgi:hypothetical protein
MFTEKSVMVRSAIHSDTECYAEGASKYNGKVVRETWVRERRAINSDTEIIRGKGQAGIMAKCLEKRVLRIEVYYLQTQNDTLK